MRDTRAGGIVRRDRTAFRTPATGVRELPTHLVPLVPGRWAIWKWVCLRGAGFPFERLADLASPALAAAADAVLDGAPEHPYRDAFQVAERSLSRSLAVAAADPRFREAVAWQNRRALESGIAALLRSPGVRGARERRNEALVASYLQRYCAKNDTIGFFGPAGWAVVTDSAEPIRVRSAPTGQYAARRVYFEGWAVRALAHAYAEPLRPWLAPRRTPLLGVTLDDPALHAPFAAPVPLSRAAAYALSLVDGVRPAYEIAALLLADPGSRVATVDDVYALLADLHDQRRIVWTLDVAPDDITPEHSVRTALAAMPPEVNAPALAALAELESARDAVLSGPVDTTLTHLDEVFERLTGHSAQRRPGELYAGRTLAYHECLRADEVTFGPSAFDPVRDALGLVLDSARWFTAAGATIVHHLCRDVYATRAAERGHDAVPFAEFWLRAHDLIFDMPPNLVASLVRALQERWAGILGLRSGQRRVILHSGELTEAVRRTFAVARAGWAGAVHHSPDLMLGATGLDAIRAGDVQWVLGELHPGTNTLRYATRVAFHPDPAALREAAARDVGRPLVTLAPSGDRRGMPARASNALRGRDDLCVVFAHDSNGYDPARSVLVGDCVLVEANGRLVVRDRAGRHELDLVEVLSDMVSMQLVQHFRLVPPAPHTPRVTIDRLVVHRESWRFAASALSFVDVSVESGRFLAVRAWARTHHLPRHVFVRFAGERKPIFVDLASLASVDLLTRGLRRARQHPDDLVTVTEMLPAPEHLWLADAHDRRYTCELRVCATDQVT